MVDNDYELSAIQISKGKEIYSMKIHAAMRENQPEIIEEAYEIYEILELSESEYASLYQDLLEDQEYFAQRKSEDDAILILGENQNDGILVQTQNKGFAYKSLFIPEARLIAEHHIRQLADYCISEGTQYSENGTGQFLMRNCINASAQKYPIKTAMEGCSKRNYSREKKSMNSS